MFSGPFLLIPLLCHQLPEWSHFTYFFDDPAESTSTLRHTSKSSLSVICLWKPGIASVKRNGLFLSPPKIFINVVKFFLPNNPCKATGCQVFWDKPESCARPARAMQLLEAKQADRPSSLFLVLQDENGTPQVPLCDHLDDSISW